MGLFAETFEKFETLGGLLPPSKDVHRAFTGQTGAEASREAAMQQADQFNRIFDLNQPFADAGIGQLPLLANSATADGAFGNLGSILDAPNVQSLMDDQFRKLTADLASSGHRRSGLAATRAADLANNVALPIEQELNRRGQRIAGIGQGGVRQQSNALGGLSDALAGGAFGVADSGAKGGQNVAGLLTSIFGAFSDERLKDNIEVIDTFGDLDVIRWNWNKEAGDQFGLTGESEGFSAQQVLKKYPQHVDIKDDYLTINIPDLLDEVSHGAV